MVPALLGREPGAGLRREEIPERARLPLELARRIAGLDPVRDLRRLVIIIVVITCSRSPDALARIATASMYSGVSISGSI